MINWLRRLFGKAPPAPFLETPVAVTFEIGGAWHEFPADAWHEFPADACQSIHSILFEDGTVWDVCNGWRSPKWNVRETWIRRRNGRGSWWRANGTSKVVGYVYDVLLR